MKLNIPIAILMILGILFLVLWATGYDFTAPQAILEAPMPTFVEIQERLVEKGYDIGTDGVDGRIGPNTLRGWGAAICDQQASKMFRKMKGEIEDGTSR